MSQRLGRVKHFLKARRRLRDMPMGQRDHPVLKAEQRLYYVCDMRSNYHVWARKCSVFRTARMPSIAALANPGPSTRPSSTTPSCGLARFGGNWPPERGISMKEGVLTRTVTLRRQECAAALNG